MSEPPFRLNEQDMEFVLRFDNDTTDRINGMTEMWGAVKELSALRSVDLVVPHRVGPEDYAVLWVRDLCRCAAHGRGTWQSCDGWQQMSPTSVMDAMIEADPDRMLQAVTELITDRMEEQFEERPPSD